MDSAHSTHSATPSRAVLARRNPVAKLGAATAVTLGLLATLDPLAPAIALAVEVAVVPWFGLRWRDLLRQALPLLAAAAGVAVVHLLFGTGTVDARLLAASGLALRVLAIALPGILTFGTIDPTDLADALVQQLRLSPRVAVGALSGLRLLPVLGEEWRTLALARRARGLDAGWNPVAHLRIFASTMFALLVAAIRRGTRLATAMDARGFSTVGVTRTRARVQRFTAADAALLAGGVLLAAAALGTSLATGVFQPVLGA